MTDPILVMMTCGHSSNGLRVKDGEHVPACVICSCIEIDPDPPKLDDRLARCHYYGKQPHHSECNFDCKWQIPICQCQRPSSPRLPFFEYHGDREFDEFYCGCHSWN